MKKRVFAALLAGLMVFSTGCSMNVDVDPETGVVNVDGVPVNELMKDLDPEALAEMAGAVTADPEALAGLAGAVSADSVEPSMPGKPAFVKDGIDVVTVFAGAQKQKLDTSGLPEDAELPEAAGLTDDELKDKMLDTFWIYYSDDTFDQYAETRDGYKLHSTGTYALKDDADFLLEDEDNGFIEINRNKKMLPGKPGLSDYESSHEYELGTLGFTQVYGPGDEGKEVEAILGDDNQLIYEEEDGTVTHLDSLWIMFKDMSFKQFVFIDEDIELYASGTYEFDENGDFRYVAIEDESGKITLTYDYNMNHKDVSKPVTYDIKSLGLSCFYVKAQADEPEVPEE